MRTAQTQQTAQARSYRPRAITVFAAAFVAGAAAAVGVNRALDVRLAQSKPRVESEAIFVALRSLPQGAAVTVWDVALREWPKAMMPSSALRASDTFSGHLLKHPLREGQPLLSIQLVPAGLGTQPAATPPTIPPPASYTQAGTPVVPAAEGDLWSPAAPVTAQPYAPAQQPAPEVAAPVASQGVSPVVVHPTETIPPATSVAVAPVAAPAQEQTVAQIPAPETVPQPEPVAPAEPVATEPLPTAIVAATDGPAMTDVTGTAPNVTAPDSPAAPDSTPAPGDGVAATAETTAAPVTVPQPQTGDPEPIMTTDVVAPPATAAAGDTPEPVVATPTAAMATPPIAAAAPTPVAAPTPAAPPATSPRPTYSRFLVVPESIAVQADASFAARPVAPQQPATAQTPTGQQATSRSGPEAPKLLPSTTTADRGGQTRPQTGPQGRPPQRHGRQAQPASPGTPANTVPQPRLGSAMFPNLSAGIEAIEGRIRGEQSAQDPAPRQAPSAAQTRPLTAR
jgi:hypothetical protein